MLCRTSEAFLESSRRGQLLGESTQCELLGAMTKDHSREQLLFYFVMRFLTTSTDSPKTLKAVHASLRDLLAATTHLRASAIRRVQDRIMFRKDNGFTTQELHRVDEDVGKSVIPALRARMDLLKAGALWKRILDSELRSHGQDAFTLLEKAVAIHLLIPGITAKDRQFEFAMFMGGADNYIGRRSRPIEDDCLTALFILHRVVIALTLTERPTWASVQARHILEILDEIVPVINEHLEWRLYTQAKELRWAIED